MSIATQLARLQNIKEAIRDAPFSKGILASSYNIENFANDIDSIDVGIHTIDANVTSADVLSGKTFYGSNEIKEEGIMTNNGAVTASINTSTTSYTIPAGYHNGNGIVSLTTETKTATPKTTDQSITPSSGKVLSGVTIKGVSVSLPAASNILYGSTASVTSNGTTLGSVNGSMVNRGSVSQSLSANGSYTIPQGYHDGTGKVTQSLSASTISGSWSENTYTASATSGYNGSAISTNTSLTKVTPSATGATVAANSRIYTSALGYLFNARPEPTMSKMKVWLVLLILVIQFQLQVEVNI